MFVKKLILKSMSAQLARSSNLQFNRTVRTSLSSYIPLNDKQTVYMNTKRRPLAPRVKTVILDWSGTTADAFVIAPAKGFYDVFKQFGVPITMQEAREPMGLRKDLHIAQILKDPMVKQRWIEKTNREPDAKDAADLFNAYLPIQLRCLEECSELLPGVPETVNVLRKEFGVRIGSTTGFTDIMQNILLRRAKEQGYVPDCAIAGDHVPNDMGVRPKPFMIYENLLQLGEYPIETVVKVDDTVGGIEEGLNAGCWTIGVSDWSNYMNIDTMEQWNQMSEPEKQERKMNSMNKLLRESNANIVISDIRFLPEAINTINQCLRFGYGPNDIFFK
jgi:phosphonoacetaldehyde hydrolase